MEQEKRPKESANMGMYVIKHNETDDAIGTRRKDEYNDCMWTK